MFKNFGTVVSENLLGQGVGAATREARYSEGFDRDAFFDRGIHESFYLKTIVELGIIGFITMLLFFIIIIRELVQSSRYLSNVKSSVFCSALLAYFFIVVIGLAKGTGILNAYPGNFLLYFFLGITIKLRYLDLKKTQDT